MLRATGSRAVNQDDAPGYFVVPQRPPSGNPIYYVRQGGTAANLAVATDPSSSAGAMSPANFNTWLDDGQIGAGDIVKFHGGGGDITGEVRISRGGAPGNPLYIVGDIDSPPKLTSTVNNIRIRNVSGPATFAHIRIAHFPDLEQTTGVEANLRVDAGAGSITDLEIFDVHVSRNRNAGSTVATDGFAFFNSGSAILRKVSTRDNLAGADSDQCITTHETFKTDVHDFDLRNGRSGFVPVGTSRIRAFDGIVANMTIRSNHDAGGRLEIHRATIVANNEDVPYGATGALNGSFIPGYSGTFLYDCRLVVRGGGQSLTWGVTEFHRCYFDWNTSGSNRWTEFTNTDASLNFFDCIFRLGSGIAGWVANFGGGTHRMERCLIDGTPGAGAGDGFGGWRGTGSMVLSRCVFKNCGNMAYAFGFNDLGGAGTLLIENCTWWDDVGYRATSKALDHAAANDANLTIRNNLFVDITTPMDAALVSGVAEYNGFDNATPSFGANAVTGAAVLADPANDDFTILPTDPFAGAGKDDADIGANIAFSRTF